MISLRLGDATCTATLPGAWRVTRLDLPTMSRPQGGTSLVDAALDAPLEGPAVHDLVRPHDTITVIVSDNTRSCRADAAVPAVLERLERAGVADSRIRILFANGTHPAMSDTAVRALLGSRILNRYLVQQHDARDHGRHVDVGSTRAGTRVQLNRLAAECDRAITVGTVVHHYFAGYGGGPKLFLPGVASYETAVQNHRRTLRDDGSFHPGCRDGNLDGNPVAEDIRDASRFFPPATSLTILLDSEGRISDACSGPMDAVHREACARVDARYAVRVPSLADITIVSAGGFPKDINFIQAHKALHRAAGVTRPGGVIVFVAECREGLGNAALLEWFSLDDDALRVALRERYIMNAHTVVAMKEKSRRYRILHVGSLPPDVVHLLGMHRCGSFMDAVAAAADLSGPHPDVLVIPAGGLLLPRPPSA